MIFHKIKKVQKVINFNRQVRITYPFPTSLDAFCKQNHLHHPHNLMGLLSVFDCAESANPFCGWRWARDAVWANIAVDFLTDVVGDMEMEPAAGGGRTRRSCLVRGFDDCPSPFRHYSSQVFPWILVAAAGQPTVKSLYFVGHEGGCDGENWCCCCTDHLTCHSGPRLKRIRKNIKVNQKHALLQDHC